MMETLQETINVIDLGYIDYLSAYKLQQEAVNRVIETGQQSIFLCEHPPVITLGRLAKEENFIISREQIKADNVEIHSIDRGGDITLHSPGQLVAYPILKLTNYGKDLHLYLMNLEKVLIDLLAEFDILASRFPGRTGVWFSGKKIASIGIGVRKWISFHGIGLNVSTDLNLFSYIKPCGLNVRMTSIADIKKMQIDMGQIKSEFLRKFTDVFNVRLTAGE
ncbi:MAG: lipoyl(octanoyl) transferase LipB [Candidatus Omnitrophica bacterium]|nr:lipoyl(octanoyl) transferase LipB [Candidatus Omnitrophota bacterium]MCB9747679.1 lipoyl(octanoyl) transferase LipB [Candidatus Omnitrophota bacterium]